MSELIFPSPTNTDDFYEPTRLIKVLPKTTIQIANETLEDSEVDEELEENPFLIEGKIGNI